MQCHNVLGMHILFSKKEPPTRTEELLKSWFKFEVVVQQQEDHLVSKKYIYWLLCIYSQDIGSWLPSSGDTHIAERCALWHHPAVPVPLSRCPCQLWVSGPPGLEKAIITRDETLLPSASEVLFNFVKPAVSGWDLWKKRAVSESPSNSHSFSMVSTLTWKKLSSSVAFDIQNISGRRSDESLRTFGVLISPACSEGLDI